MQSGEWKAILSLAEDPYERQLHYCPDVRDLALIRQNLRHVNGRIWLNAFLKADGSVQLSTRKDTEAGEADLGQVLEAFPRQNFHLRLQEKSMAAYTQIMATIHQYNASGRISISGGNLWWNRKISHIYPGTIILTDQDIPFLYLPKSFSPLFVTEIAVTYRKDYLATGSPSFIERCHRQGLRLDFQNVADKQTAQMLLDQGADGIVTPEPGDFAALFPLRKSTRTQKARRPVGARKEKQVSVSV